MSKRKYKFNYNHGKTFRAHDRQEVETLTRSYLERNGPSTREAIEDHLLFHGVQTIDYGRKSSFSWMCRPGSSGGMLY